MSLYCPKCGTYPQNSGGSCLCQQQIHYTNAAGIEIEVNQALSGLVSENGQLRARNAELEAKLAALVPDAGVLAEVHMGDGDELGVIARRLIDAIAAVEDRRPHGASE